MVAPTSALDLPRSYLAATLAASATFQAWVGAPGNAAAALARVFFEETLPTATTPIAIVTSYRYDRHQIAGGTRNYSIGRGELYLFFRDAVLKGESTVQADVEDSLNTFENNLGNTILDMDALFGQAGYLDAQGMRADGPVARVEFQEANALAAGSFWEAVYTVEFMSL